MSEQFSAFPDPRPILSDGRVATRSDALEVVSWSTWNKLPPHTCRYCDGTVES